MFQNNLINSNFEDPEYHYKLYFKKDYRKKRENEIYFITDFIDFIFQEIYITNRKSCLLKINLPIEHPLLNFIIKKENCNNRNFSDYNNNNIIKKINSDVNIINQNETEILKIENIKIQNKNNMMNFTIEKKYKNNIVVNKEIDKDENKTNIPTVINIESNKENVKNRDREKQMKQ